MAPSASRRTSSRRWSAIARWRPSRRRRGSPTGSSACRRGWPAGRRGAWTPWEGGSPLQRDVPEGKPALELGLERELGADLRLEAELALVVALLLAAGRDERVEGTALVVVDPVHALPGLVLEGEHGGEDAIAVAAHLQLAADRVDAGHQILEIGVAQDHPAVAEGVGFRLHLRARLLGRRADELLHVLGQRGEVGGLELLEDDRRRAGRLQPQRALELDVRRGHREQPIGRGLLELPLAPQDVEEAHAAPRPRPERWCPGAGTPAGPAS